MCNQQMCAHSKHTLEPASPLDVGQTFLDTWLECVMALQANTMVSMVGRRFPNQLIVSTVSCCLSLWSHI